MMVLVSTSFGLHRTFLKLCNSNAVRNLEDGHVRAGCSWMPFSGSVMPWGMVLTGCRSPTMGLRSRSLLVEEFNDANLSCHNATVFVGAEGTGRFRHPGVLVAADYDEAVMIPLR